MILDTRTEVRAYLASAVASSHDGVHLPLAIRRARKASQNVAFRSLREVTQNLSVGHAGHKIVKHIYDLAG